MLDGCGAFPDQGIDAGEIPQAAVPSWPPKTVAVQLSMPMQSNRKRTAERGKLGCGS